MVDQKQSLEYLHLALEAAASRRGFCAPNPAVGAVVVKNGELLAVGKHKGCGHAHAEVEALNQVGDQAKGADLYVTLEPCCHQGRTPPCTDLILARGIARVFFAYLDPNPVVSGKGMQILQNAGVRCQHLPIKEVDHFYRAYNYWVKYQKPWVRAKIAISRDAKIAGPNGKSVAITGDVASRFTHQQRYQSDAILTTAKTIIADNPKFNVRIEDKIYKKPLFILDRSLRLAQSHYSRNIFETAEKITLFYSEKSDKKFINILTKKNINCIEILEDKKQLNLSAILDYIGQLGVHDLWVETGGRCFQSFFNRGLLQQAFIYLANKDLGQEALAAFCVPFVPQKMQFNWEDLGNDVLLNFYLPSMSHSLREFLLDNNDSH